MKRTYGSQSMIAPLRRVLVKRPDEVFAGADPAKWHYSGRPNLQSARREHDQLVAILEEAGVEVLYLKDVPPGLADAIYVHDPALVTDRGAIVLRMGKALRRGEEEAMAQCLEALGVPVLYRLHGQARAEGGDLLWIDHDTLAVGLGFRTNGEGLRQVAQALAGLGANLLPVSLPYDRGPESCLHLMSLINIVDVDLAVVYLPLLSEPFWQYLRGRDFRLIPVPQEEFATMGPNVLTLAPGKCLMLEGNPVTQKRLEEAGCEVLTYRGEEISLKAEGGPTCLTRPILREH
jgi:dimethylargininase